MTFTDLSNEISPFPDTAGNDLIYHEQQQHRPQKLLPIRSNTGGDSGGSSSPPETHSLNAPTTAQDSSSMEVGGDGNPISFTNRTLEEIEQIGYDSDVYSKEKRKFIHELLVQFQSSIGNNNGENSPRNDLDQLDTHLVISPTTFSDGPNNGELRENEGCDGGGEKREKREKREKCSGLEIEEYVMKMVDEVLKKQEEMHRQFMEVIRKHDEDRMTREDEWRNQELVRRNREKEMRDQQNARNLALISFIESYLGYRIIVPQTPLVQPNQQTVLVQTSQQTALTPPNQQNTASVQPNQQTSLIQPNQQNTALVQPNHRKRNHDQQECSTGSNTKRWPQPEVKALISIRTAVDHKLRCREVKHNSVWEEISEAMSSLGYDRTANKCKEKWENINKYFKKTIAGGRRPKSTKTCPYFHELDLLYKNGSLNPGTPLLLSNGDTPLQLTNGSEGDWNEENKVHSTPETLKPEGTPV